MATIYFVPQLPTDGRYTKWWYTEFKDVFKKYFDDVVVLGGDIIEDLAHDRAHFKDFSSVHNSAVLEIAQIEDYIGINESIDDVLFCTDISFPGIFPNILFTKRFIGKKFIFCHATAKNKYDFFSDVRRPKFKVETGLSKMFDKVFVGSHYHKEKLGWNNVEVIRLPKPPNEIITNFPLPKVNNIISVSRPCVQKVNLKLEKKVERQVGSKIIRKTFTNPEEYSRFLSQSKILFISTQEDTFNYTIMDALRCGCIPVAPRALCFPEILPNEYLYDDHIEAAQICRKILIGSLPVPEMLCQDEVDNFYPNMIEIMKGV